MHGPGPHRPTRSGQRALHRRRSLSAALRSPHISLALGLLAVCLLIVANGVFVAAEFALVAVDRSRVDQQAEAGSRRARLLRGLLRRLSFHLSGAQLGITVTSLIIGFLAEPVLAELLSPVLARGVALTVGFVLATVVQMIVGELVPKGLAIARPEPTGRALAPFIQAYGTIFGPVIRFLNGSANWAVRRLGMEPKEELSHVRTLPEFERLIAASEREGMLAGSASALLTRSIRFGVKSASDALIPRTAVAALSIDQTVADLVQLSADTGHSRFPVYGADLDDVRGVVHVRGAHGVGPDDRHAVRVSSLMTDVLAVPESRELEDVLLDMRSARQHLAVVVDEYGGTAGIVTLEDIVEEIVGEIADEYDIADKHDVADEYGVADEHDLSHELTREREWVLEGTLHPDEVADRTGLVLPEGEFDTLAGFVLEQLGHLPEIGEHVEWEGWTFTVVALDRRRIAEVGLVAPAEGGDQR